VLSVGNIIVLKHRVTLNVSILYCITLNCEASLSSSIDSFALPDGYYAVLMPIRISRNWSFQGPIRNGSRATRVGCVRDEGICSSSFPHPGRIACCPAPDRRPPATKALHTIWGNNTSIVSSSWWWTYKCPKHVEQIINAINNGVATSWFYSLYNDARTNVHHIHRNKAYVIRKFQSDTALGKGKWCFRFQCRIKRKKM